MKKMKWYHYLLVPFSPIILILMFAIIPFTIIVGLAVSFMATILNREPPEWTEIFFDDF